MSSSSATTKPKVFKRPAPKQQNALLYASKVGAWYRANQQKAILLGVTCFAVLFMGMQSVSTKNGEVVGDVASKEKFIFFSPSSSNAATGSQPFVIKGKDEEIVGQITQMPSDEKEANPLNNARNVDNQANQDLLSVVNKH